MIVTTIKFSLRSQTQMMVLKNKLKFGLMYSALTLGLQLPLQILETNVERSVLT